MRLVIFTNNQTLYYIFNYKKFGTIFISCKFLG